MIIQSTAVPKFARAARVAHVHEKGLHATIVKREGLREFHITLEPTPEDSVASMAERLHSFVTSNQAKIARQETFGADDATLEFRSAQAKRFAAEWPVTSVRASSCNGMPLAGVHTLAIAGPELETIHDDGRAVGTLFSDGFAQHCILGGIVPNASAHPRLNRTRLVFEQIGRHLENAGMSLASVARTWLYLDDILGWYDIFNHERRAVFEEHDVLSHCVPASTGIGAGNPLGAALMAGAWAVQSSDPSVTVQAVTSPLQCPARDYGSCFSRAVEIGTPDLRRLFVSGTASIEPGGRTAHPGDVEKQVALTFDVIHAILESRGMAWHNTSRATAYFKSARDAWALPAYLEKHKISMPALVTEAYVCRDDLLFEIEIDAVQSQQNRVPLL